MKKSILKTIICTLFSLFFVCSTIPAAGADDAGAPNEKKLIALTFDDGPNTTTTNDVLDLLEQYNAKGSFFLIGNNINDESAKSVKRAYDMGCEIDNHSRSHGNMGAMSPEKIKEEVSYVDEKVYDIIGEYPKFFRPPFIDTSQTMYENIDIPFICGIDCQDYMENVTAQERADYILNGARDGVIVLLHDAAGNNQTVGALKIAMPKLIEEGYEFVTLTELFERQGEKPIKGMLYTCVAKYPCSGYSEYMNIFTGKAIGEPSWSGWHDTAVFDGKLLEDLGDSYAVEVEYSCEYEPVIAFQKWSDGMSIWEPVKPYYHNGKKACFLASDLISVLDKLKISYTDLDRITLTPYGGNMTVTKVDILTKASSGTTEPIEPSYIRGDVNGDDTFDIADIVSMQKWLLKQCDTLENWSAGDLLKDDKLNVFDLIMMKREFINRNK